jgi:hypothetical protein
MVSQVFCGIFCATFPFGNLCFGLIPCTILSILGNVLCFNVGSKEAFEVSLADVSQSQMQGKTDVVLEFHVDDTTGANEVLWFTRMCFSLSI